LIDARVLGGGQGRKGGEALVSGAGIYGETLEGQDLGFGQQEYRGIVTVVDRRVLRKRYGQHFLNYLPDCTRVMAPLATLPQEARRWLSVGK